MSKIKVALRVRPLSTREQKEGHVVVVGLEDKSAFITNIKVPERPSADSRQRLRQFDFDHVFWLSHSGYEGATQNVIYAEMGPSLEKSILTGQNATVLCYGQSGTGKTHSMLGTKEDPGLIPRLCQSLWEKLKGQETRKSNFLFEVSFMEIYREKVRDLLARSEKVLKLREHPQLGPHVQGLTRIQINEEWEFLNLLWDGERKRATGTTGSNRRSSRSHAIWTLYLTSSIKSDSSGKGSVLITRTNQVHLVDLAGSEKADLITTKNLLAEGKDINRSLVTLGNVISSLAEKAIYIPYRDSALTFLLKDSLGGNSSTSIIITASPASCCHAQTLNSFRFAQRARLVENQPKIGLFHQANDSTGLYSSMAGNELRKDISKLASIIRAAQNNGGILRGLTPRHSWNRLITAIENWNHNDKQAIETHQEILRAASEDTTSINFTTSTSTATMTTNSCSSDAMVQAEMKDEDSLTTSSSSNMSLPNSPSKIMGTEVFIPSSTIKCLTWKQEEIHKLPTSQSQDSSDSNVSFVSPPTSPIPESKINHLKYLLQVHYPTSHWLNSESRIAEKIHGSIPVEVSSPESFQLTPIEVATNLESGPVIRERYPTLIGECEIENNFEELSPRESEGESHNDDDMSNSSNGNNFTNHDLNNFTSSTPKSRVKNEEQFCQLNVVARENISEQNDHIVPQFGFKIPKVSEFTKSRPLPITPLESTDEYEQDDNFLINDLEDEQECQFGRYRAISANHQFNSYQQRRTSTPKDENKKCFHRSFDSSSSSSLSSSSSYESLVIKPVTNKTKVVENGTFDFRCVEEKVDETPITKPVRPVEQHKAKICSIENSYKDHIIISQHSNQNPIFEPMPPPAKKLDCTNSTKFRTHFVKELDQMEAIGKQIESLKQLTQRHQIVKPYLEKIVQLQCMDHRIPDPKLDAEIEECSGWNISIELARVQKEIITLNKTLKLGSKRVESESITDSLHEHESAKSTSSSSDSYSKSIPNSSSSESSNSRNKLRSNSNFKAFVSPSSVSTPKRFALPLQQQKNPPLSRNIFKPQMQQPSQSWNLQFPLSSSSYQQRQFYQVPEVEIETHHKSHVSNFNQNQFLPNPFTNTTTQYEEHNFEPVAPNSTYFQNFHSEAQQRLAERWQPILPKTHDYLHRMRLNCSLDGCNDYDHEHRECYGGIHGHGGNCFHPYQYSPRSQIYNHATNPALLYPTNFPFQQSPPPTVSFYPPSANYSPHPHYQNLPATNYNNYDHNFTYHHRNPRQANPQEISSQFDDSGLVLEGNENLRFSNTTTKCSKLTKDYDPAHYTSLKLLRELQSIRKQMVDG